MKLLDQQRPRLPQIQSGAHRPSRAFRFRKPTTALTLASFLLSLALLATSAPAQELTRHEFESPQMGTLFKIVLYAPDQVSAKTAADAAFKLAGKLNASFSDYEADSELRQLIDRGEAEVSTELFEILTLSKKIAKATGGAFDITTGAHTRNWRKARITGELPTAAEIAAAKAASGWEKLYLDPATRKVTLAAGMQLDLGGIAKGYAADAMLALLKKQGYPRASVAAGGDIAVGDPPADRKAWEIGISPDGQKKTARTIQLVNQAVSTSGSAEQWIEINGKRYSHIVDPKSGLGLKNSLPVSVVTNRASLSDAFATAFSVLGKAEAESKPIAADNELEVFWGKETASAGH